jgi:hypothetical protein
MIHESGSSIIMDSDGNIQIQCKAGGKIRIGATNTSPQRVIKGDALVEAIEKFCNKLESGLLQGGNLSKPLTGIVDMTDAFADFKTDADAALSAIVQTE